MSNVYIRLVYELNALMAVGIDVTHTIQNVLCSRSVMSVNVEVLVNFSLNPQLIFEPDMIFLIL